MAHATRRIDSPLGPLDLEVDGVGAVTRIAFDAPPTPEAAAAAEPQRAALDEVARQLGEYFAGRRTAFELALAPAGTAFQREVWRLLGTLPYGTTRTYGQLAVLLGDAKKVRAVGAANGKNPIAIVVPCHRVIGASGELVGYAAGLARKQALLALEGARPAAAPQLTLL
jgi:methylated-DNA-[protein]-cysteine S-methyltransferase